jgi:hypothetical protein
MCFIHDLHFGGAVTRRSASAWVSDLVAAAGPRATDAYIEFFTATIRNRNTRLAASDRTRPGRRLSLSRADALAYARACYQFFHWCQENGLKLQHPDPLRQENSYATLADQRPSRPAALAASFNFSRSSAVCAREEASPKKLRPRVADIKNSSAHAAGHGAQMALQWDQQARSP